MYDNIVGNALESSAVDLDDSPEYSTFNSSESEWELKRIMSGKTII